MPKFRTDRNTVPLLYCKLLAPAFTLGTEIVLKNYAPFRVLSTHLIKGHKRPSFFIFYFSIYPSLKAGANFSVYIFGLLCPSFISKNNQLNNFFLEPIHLLPRCPGFSTYRGTRFVVVLQRFLVVPCFFHPLLSPSYGDAK